MFEYIIHPLTKEIQKAENFQMFNDWARLKFIKATAEQEEQENGEYFELTLTLENGEVRTSKLKQDAYFNGASFYLNEKATRQ